MSPEGTPGDVAFRFIEEELSSSKSGLRGPVPSGKRHLLAWHLHPLYLFPVTATDSPPFLSFLQGRPGPPGVAGPQGEKVSQTAGWKGPGCDKQVCVLCAWSGREADVGRAAVLGTRRRRRWGVGPRDSAASRFARSI